MVSKATIDLDRFGLPLEMNPSGPDFTFSIAFLVSHLPGSALAVGEEFKLDWKGGGASYVGSGTFASIDEAEGLRTARLKVRARLSLTDQEPGDLEYEIAYDPARRTVVSSKGTAKVGEETFNFELWVTQPRTTL